MGHSKSVITYETLQGEEVTEAQYILGLYPPLFWFPIAVKPDVLLLLKVWQYNWNF